MSAHTQTNGSTSAMNSRATLVVAHPGHELRVHGWLETARPEVWVITDGSGRTNCSRIASTTRVLEAIGAMPGPIYGQLTDADLYNSVLNFDHGYFVDLVDQLAIALVKDRVDFVAGDAQEGYNPAHDICRLIINAAVRLAKKKSTNQIANYDFTLVGLPTRCSEKVRSQSIWLDLDDTAFARKLSAARNYPELQVEVEAALTGFADERFSKHPELAQRARSDFGVTEIQNFRVECLRRVDVEPHANTPFTGEAPFYEVYGQQQVLAGHYHQVIRYREHMLPLAAALETHIERSI